VRPFRSFVLLIALLAAAALPAPAQDTQVIRFIRVPTPGPVVLNAVGGAGHTVDSFKDLGDLTLACVSFTNNDERTVKSVRVQFAYFNAGGDRSDGTLLTRNGTFSTGVHERAANPLTNRVNREDCVPLHPPHGGFSAIVVYLDRVDFSDGSSWTSSGVHVANHVDPGSPNSAYAYTDPAGTANPAGVPVATIASSELPPLFMGTFAACAQTSAAAGNVFVSAQPGTAAPGNLFNIGDVSVCAPSGNPAHDDAALQLVKQSHVAIRAAQVFRVYFPALNTSPACTDDVRLLNRVLLNPPADTELAHPPKAGEYTTVVHVTVDPDGRPLQVSTSTSAGPPEFDDAARRSALASRYWPAMAAGKPVAGAFDFPMRWVVDPTRQPASNFNSQDYTLTRVFGPVVHSAAPGCAV
jgi:TonB family protein